MTIPNNIGGCVHAKPSAAFVKVASRYDSAITVAAESSSHGLGSSLMNGKSIMGLMMLLLPEGARMTICCRGKDAKAAAAALEQLVLSKFSEE